MATKTSVKVGDDVISFLKKLRTNRRKTDIDDQDLSYSKLLSIIVRYFKNSEEEYLKIVKLTETKNAR